GIASDMSEHKRVLEQINAVNKHLETVAANSPIIIWAMDRDAKVTLAMGKNIADLGLDAKELIGMSAHDVIPGNDDVRNGIEAAMRGEERSMLIETALFS